MTGAYVWAALCYLPALYLITVCLYTITVTVVDTIGQRRTDRELRAVILADLLAAEAQRAPTCGRSLSTGQPCPDHTPGHRP